MKQKLTATVDIIGINPFVPIPDQVLHELQKSADKKTGPIPIKGTLQGKPFKQTVVKFRGVWRLYLNTQMRIAARVNAGDKVAVELEFDSDPRIVPIPRQLATAFAKNEPARMAFAKLTPYRQKEINRYLTSLKTEESMKRNVEKIIRFLIGKKTSGVLFRKYVCFYSN